MVVRQTEQTDGNGSLPLNFFSLSPYFGAVNSHCLKTIVFGYLLSNKDSGRCQAPCDAIFVGLMANHAMSLPVPIALVGAPGCQHGCIAMRPG